MLVVVVAEVLQAEQLLIHLELVALAVEVEVVKETL
jgi:hypothetical protein